MTKKNQMLPMWLSEGFPREGAKTNQDLKDLIALEAKIHMRDDIIVTFYPHAYGVTASFKADMGEAYLNGKPAGYHVFALISVKKFARIQTMSSVIKKIRSDERLYLGAHRDLPVRGGEYT